MAVINGLEVLAVSFKVNDSSSNFLNVSGTFNTVDVLNGGELLDNTLEYQFKVSGLQGHTIKSIVIKSLLLTSEGELCSTRNLTMGIDSYGYIFKGDLNTSELNKTIVSTKFIYSELLESNTKTINLVVKMNSKESCYYGLQSIIINLQDIDYSVNITFNGSKTNRTVSTITIQSLLINQSTEPITFSKDPTTNFDLETDAVEGRAYFKKDGIYVDGYQYGVNTTATETKKGVVSLKSNLDTDSNDKITIPTSLGIAATPLLVIDAISKSNNLINDDIITPASSDTYGFVKLQDSFETFVDESTGQSGIIAPAEEGVAASALLVYNTIITLKLYTDDKVNSISNPSIELEDNSTEKIEEDYIFSKDFIKTNNKIYINWFEYSGE